MGRLHDGATFRELENTCRIEFWLEIEEKRKSKDGKNKPIITNLLFEAWDSAARAINSKASPGDTVVVESAARANLMFDAPADETFFRVTSFKIFKEQKN